jgi:multidrug efflux system outer membrane protein
MKLGPDYRRPNPAFDSPKQYQHADHAAPAPAYEDEWWTVFGDGRLNDLVDEALKNNLDLKQAADRILEVKAQFVQVRADRFPELTLQAEAQRRRQLASRSIPGISADRETTLYTLSFPASFELDLWGRLARSEEAARAQLLAATENRHILAQSIVAETIGLYFRIESLERRIRINQRTVENYEQNLSFVRSRYERGLVDVLNLVQARRAVSQAKSLLPGLQQELGTVQQALSVLLGRYPETGPARGQPENYFQRLPPVPPGLPSDLLLRRPDIRAAEADLMALNARIGAAKASRFPRVALTGSLGYTSDELDRLFTPANHLWNIAMGLAQPLFDAGRLEAAQAAAEARYDQGVTAYAKIVLDAFAEVEGALLTRKKQLERRRLLLHFVDDAKRAYDIALERYGRGVVDYLTVLDAQRSYLEAQENLVLAELAILTNRVTLHRSLGGGWGMVETAIEDTQTETEQNPELGYKTDNPTTGHDR